VQKTSTSRSTATLTTYEDGDRSMHYAYTEADLRPRPG